MSGTASAPTDRADALEPRLAALLRERVVGLGDDQLLHAQRDGEWTGHAPLLEEDIAIANCAQDELGHATLLYGVAHRLGAPSPDDLAFRRDAGDWRALRLVQLPRGDWAFTMVRRWLLDLHESLWLPELTRSSYAPLAEAAAAMRREEVFHLRHARLWLERLGLGSAEANRRARAALEALWPHAPQLFAREPGDDELITAGLLPDPAALEAPWREAAERALTAAELPVPAWPDAPAPQRDEPTEHLAPLIARMQEVARSDPEATAW